ncbi:uncharacterized protein V1516DRAFT_673410 [Lipomyces oligophaga]|uniref:uncharacterized protein n=1 Tax=Lipomyces oligophaga TaxID=45792 RepID=UPI0034CD2F77
MDRLYFVPSAGYSSRKAPPVAAHRAHLSHYLSQLSALEREQQRLAIEKELLVRRQAQLSAKRNQLTFLIAEEQDLVLRAVQQQKAQEQREAEAILQALVDREAQIVRRQKLRQAVYLKQQQDQARRDAELQQFLQYIQQPEEQEEEAPTSANNWLSQFFEQQQLLQQRRLQQHQQKQPLTLETPFEQARFLQAPSVADSESELESPFKPGSINEYLAKQGIRSQGFSAPCPAVPETRKRGSHRGPRTQSHQSLVGSTGPGSAKLVPDVNYQSTQDFLSALFGGAAAAEQEGQELAPKSGYPEPTEKSFEIRSAQPSVTTPTTVEEPKEIDLKSDLKSDPKSDSKPLTYAELAQILFGTDEDKQESESLPAQEPVKRDGSPETRPPFHYTLSHFAPFYNETSEGTAEEAVVPPPKNALDLVEENIDKLKDKISTASYSIERAASEINPEARRTKLMSIQQELEKYYSDLDDILLTPPEGEIVDEADQTRRQQLRLKKHAVTSLAVEAADRIDTILSPPSVSESDNEEYDVIDRNVLEKISQDESSTSSESTSLYTSEMPSRGATPSVPAGAENITEVEENGETFVVEKTASSTTGVLLEDAKTEKDETLDEEEKSEVQVPLALNDEDDVGSAIEDASRPISRNEQVQERFVPESGDRSGHVTLETNTGNEQDEFLDEEEKSEERVRLSQVDAIKLEAKRTSSPIRHVVLEDEEE